MPQLDDLPCNQLEQSKPDGLSDSANKQASIPEKNVPAPRDKSNADAGSAACCGLVISERKTD
jgi:hypothetical protein